MMFAYLPIDQYVEEGFDVRWSNRCRWLRPHRLPDDSAQQTWEEAGAVNHNNQTE